MKNKKSQIKILDVFLLLEEYSAKCTKNTPKYTKQKGLNTFFSLVTTTIISTYSCKISKDCFKFLKTLKKYPKYTQKFCICPQQRDTSCENSLSSFLVRVIQKTSGQN